MSSWKHCLAESGSSKVNSTELTDEYVNIVQNKRGNRRTLEEDTIVPIRVNTMGAGKMHTKRQDDVYFQRGTLVS